MKATRRPSSVFTPAIVAGLMGMMLSVHPLSASARTRSVTLGDPDTGDNGAKPNASSVVLVADKSVGHSALAQTHSRLKPTPHFEITWVWLSIRYGSRLP